MGWFEREFLFALHVEESALPIQFILTVLNLGDELP
jgi:hypothetical protein